MTRSKDILPASLAKRMVGSESPVKADMMPGTKYSQLRVGGEMGGTFVGE